MPSARSLHACAVLLALLLAPPAALAAPPACNNPLLARTSDYAWVLGSAAYADTDGDAESGSAFRWLVDGTPLAPAAPVGEGLLLNFDGSPFGGNGEPPALQQGVAYAPGRFGQALALGGSGALRYARAGNLSLDQGTVELWIALRADGTDPVYASQWQVPFFYEAPNGDQLLIATDPGNGILYAGGTVNGQWQSAYGAGGVTRTWRAGEWHHVALTYSATESFIRLYVDGRPVADTNEHHYFAPAATGATFTVGGPPVGTAAHVWLDGVRLSSRVAGATELAARAHRTDAPRANEVWLATSALAPGHALAFEFTPSAANGAGAPCTTVPWDWAGPPLSNPWPAPTLLAPGTRALDLSVTSAQATDCAWSLGAPLPYAQMTPFTQGAGTLAHRTLVTGLAGTPNTVDTIFVRAASAPDFVLPLPYRSRGVANPSFPRTGNLWGSQNFLGQTAAEIAKIDLWLGAEFPSALVRQLRQINPDILILTSINAVENSGLPPDYYLKDVDGNLVEVWPGSYRLNLTKPYVADYQARYAYQRMLDEGLLLDGVFFDNVMTTQSWQTHDIWGNRRALDANEDGLEDAPAELDSAWKAGVFREIRTFRQLMPQALVTGHSMNIDESGIDELFNGISYGFVTANVIEREPGQTFDDLHDAYDHWMSRARAPHITMFEGSPVDQIAYGYSFEPAGIVPPSTLEFARTHHPWMRFALGLTLLNDGYFAYEYGDTWHGNDWWYDELDFDLGQPRGPAARLDAGFDPGPNQLVNGGFESAIGAPWQSWADSGYALSVTRDLSTSTEGAASVRLDVGAALGEDWRTEFAQAQRSLAEGTSYRVRFRARADRVRTIGVASQKGSPDWRSFGLRQTVAIDTTWREYTVTFAATGTTNDARLQFLLGASAGTVWLDDVQLTLAPPALYAREFTHGMVLVNGTDQPQTATVGPGWKRLTGSQAAKFDTFVDDSSAAFATPAGAWTRDSLDTPDWLATGPFFHAWAVRAHKGTGEARWALPVSEPGVDTLSVWWPAAPEAAGWNAAVRFDVVANGATVASATFDQRSGGDRWHTIGAANLGPSSNAYVKMTCSGAPGIADAIHFVSAARYNDGSPATVVTLQPFDAIVLARDGTVGAGPASPTGARPPFALLVRSANPVRDAVDLEIVGAPAGPVDVRVFDVQGREVRHLRVTARGTGHDAVRMPLARGAIAPGLYLVRARSADGRTSASGKLTVVR